MDIEFKKELRLIVLWLIENKNDAFIRKDNKGSTFIEVLEYYYEMDINDIIKISGIDVIKGSKNLMLQLKKGSK